MTTLKRGPITDLLTDKYQQPPLRDRVPRAVHEVCGCSLQNYVEFGTRVVRSPKLLDHLEQLTAKHNAECHHGRNRHCKAVD
jgi:hypothetical protein